jgi:4-hydroxythreonine-4-phosphate dehydrogenase
MTSELYCPRLVLTPGEPAGIGPDIVISAAQQPFNAEIVVVADPDLLKKRAELLRLPLDLISFNPTVPARPHQPGKLHVLPVTHLIKGQPGKPVTANAGYVLETLKTACTACLENKFDAMVTGPVHKAIINQAGFPFTGHTEFLAEICAAGYPVMMLANRNLRVALVTTHLPLSGVSHAITQELLEKVIHIVWQDLNMRFGLSDPELLVCGLNPHAGEEGHLGTEEIDVIIPVLERLRKNGLRLQGPVPADTAFTHERLKNIDVVIAMYHDQGLPVLKAQGFGETVNITLGLPILRTSVDHGTALPLAGTGMANSSSLIAAIECAITLSCARSKTVKPATPFTHQTTDAV